MSISIKKYVDITSGVGGASAVKERELILRLFTTNTMVPAGVVLEMTTINDVAEFFGTDSEEYERASMYFSFISKSLTQAKKISFARYAAAGPLPPGVLGGVTDTTIAQWNLISDGQLKFSAGGTEFEVSGLSFLGDVSLTEVASTIQTALQAVAGMATTTFVYNNVTQRFNMTLVGTTPPAEVVLLAAVGGTDLKDPLGWQVADGVVTSPGSAASNELEFIIEADEVSDNYGSFAIVGAPLTIDKVEAIASWNAAQNVKYMYLVPVKRADITAWNNTLGSYPGCALTLVANTNAEYDEQVPGIILGATDYSVRNAGQNYMFQQIPGLTPKVNDNSEANGVDATRVNYYGRTKNAGQPIDFYQNGYLCGVNTSPLQMNVHANEQWFKSNILTKMMDLLLALPIIPASSEGRTIVLGGLQSSVDQALFNGTIKAEKDLTVTQRAYVYQVTGDPLAWHQVQSIGYWMDATVIPEVQTNGTTRYRVDYTLVYSKADAVNKITGRDILI